MTIWRRIELRKLFSKIIIYVCVSVLAVFSSFPVYWMVATSLKPVEDVYRVPPLWIPDQLSTVHYKRVIFDSLFSQWFINSLIIATVATILSIIIGILAAYAFIRFRFFTKKILFGLVTLSRVLPRAVIIIPLFIITNQVRLVDTHVGLIFSYLAITVPLSVWLLSGFLRSVPKELEEAAMIDGCNRLQALYRVVVPICKPAIVAVAAISFRMAWNEFFLGLVLSRTNARPLSVGLTFYEIEEIADYGAIMAASTLMVIPVLFIFIITQKYLLKGLGEGALKG